MAGTIDPDYVAIRITGMVEMTFWGKQEYLTAMPKPVAMPFVLAEIFTQRSMLCHFPRLISDENEFAFFEIVASEDSDAVNWGRTHLDVLITPQRHGRLSPRTGAWGPC